MAVLRAKTRCVLCSENITSVNNSEEHIIPNSIGGRKKVKGFICRKCNNDCDWDRALAEQLKPLNLLLKINRERGTTPGQKFKTISGTEVLLKHDGIELPKPHFEKIQNGDKTKIRFSARSLREAKKMIGGLRQRYPHFDEKQFKIEEQSYYLEDPLHMQFKFGGNETGRSLVKSALAFAFHKGIDPKFCDDAISYLKDASAMKVCFGYYYEKDIILNRPQDKIFHCVAVSNALESNLLLGYVEYFGAYRIIVCLSSSYTGPQVNDIYAINPIEGNKLNLEFKFPLTRNELPALYRCEKTTNDAMRKAFDIPLTLAIKNDFEKERNRVLHEAVEYAFQNCGVIEGEVLTEAHIREMSYLLMNKLWPFLRRHTGVSCT